MLPEKFQKLHGDYLHEWMRADEVLKMVERLKIEVFIPSINELRYAARRIVQAELLGLSQSHDDEAIQKKEETIRIHLIEAIENCRKARHDAIDSAVNYAHQEITNLVKLVGVVSVIKIYPEYKELSKKIKKIDALIINSRKERTSLDDEYEKIKNDHLKQIVDLNEKLMRSELLFNAEIKQRKNAMRIAVAISVLVGWFINLVISVLGSAIVTMADKIHFFDTTIK